MGIEALAKADYDGWCGGECAATWEQTGEWTKANHARAAAAVRAALIPPTLAADLALACEWYGIGDGEGMTDDDDEAVHDRLAAFAARLRGNGES